MLRTRNITDLETQGAVLNELKRMTWDYHPKIWLGVWLVANYPRIRPGELRTIRERDIDLIRQVRDMEPAGMPDMMFFRHGPKPPKVQNHTHHLGRIIFGSGGAGPVRTSVLKV